MPDEQNKQDQLVHSQKADQIINTGKKVIELVSGSVTKEITDAMTAISGIAQKGTIIFLQSFGAGLIVICLAMKIDIEGFSMAKLTSQEYVVTVFAGLLFILAGSGMRFYILMSSLDLQKTLRQAGQDIMKKQADAANKQLEQIGEKAQEVATAPIVLPPGT